MCSAGQGMKRHLEKKLDALEVRDDWQGEPSGKPCNGMSV